MRGIEAVRRHWKWVAAVALAAAAVPLALHHFVWRWNTPEGTVRRIFRAISENRLDEALTYVDPHSEPAIYWNEDRSNLRTRVLRALQDWQVSFDLKLKTVKRGDKAEVQLLDGTMKISSRSGESRAAYPLSLRSLGLIFYLEEREGRWLLTDLNYDLGELSEELSL